MLASLLSDMQAFVCVEKSLACRLLSTRTHTGSDLQQTNRQLNKEIYKQINQLEKQNNLSLEIQSVRP